MKDDQFEALDKRANTAAQSVQAAAQRRSRPTFDADRPTAMPEPAAVGQSRAPRRTAWIAAAAVVALVAGAVTFAATRPDGGNDTIAAGTQEEPRPFLADDLPGGMEPITFMDVPRNGGLVLDTSPMQVYGEAVDQPRAAAFVVDAEVFEGFEFVPFEVDGLTLYRAGDVAVRPGQRVMLKQDGFIAVMAGATEDDAVTLARTVSVVDGNVSVDTKALPDGWTRLVTVDGAWPLMSQPRSSSTKGYLAAYGVGMNETEGVPIDEYASIQVSSVAGDEPTMWAARLFFPDTREVTVRGHRGFSGTHAADDAVPDESSSALVSRAVSWVERPGEVISVTGLNVSEEQLLAVAESLRPVTEQEWADLVVKSQLGGFGEDRGPNNSEIGRTTGTFDDGTNWSLTVVQMEPVEDRPKGTVVESNNVFTDLRVAVESDGSSGDGSSSSGSSGSGSDGVFKSMETFHTGGRHFASGILADEATLVQLQRSDGSVLADATIVEVAGYRVFVTELTEDPTIVVALRADGSEAGRVTFADLDENANFYVDGNGSSTFEEQGTPVDGAGNPTPAPVQPPPTTVLSDD